MKKEEAIQRILHVMQIAEAAYFTTIDTNGFPQTRAMLNLRNPQQFPDLRTVFEEHTTDFLIYFTTNTSSSKIVQIQHNPNVSVYYCQPNEWKGVMFGGTVEIMEDMAIKHTLWQENWDRYYPKGLSDPDYAILRLQPTIAKLYDRLTFFTLELR